MGDSQKKVDLFHYLQTMFGEAQRRKRIVCWHTGVFGDRIATFLITLASPIIRTGMPTVVLAYFSEEQNPTADEPYQFILETIPPFGLIATRMEWYIRWGKTRWTVSKSGPLKLEDGYDWRTPPSDYILTDDLAVGDLAIVPDLPHVRNAKAWGGDIPRLEELFMDRLVQREGWLRLDIGGLIFVCHPSEAGVRAFFERLHKECCWAELVDDRYIVVSYSRKYSQVQGENRMTEVAGKDNINTRLLQRYWRQPLQVISSGTFHAFETDANALPCSRAPGAIGMPCGSRATWVRLQRRRDEGGRWYNAIVCACKDQCRYPDTENDECPLRSAPNRAARVGDLYARAKGDFGYFRPTRQRSQ